MERIIIEEKEYFFFRERIEETIAHFKSKDLNVTLEQIHRFLSDNIWPQLNVEGIIYDDKPTNPWKSDRIYSEISNLYYKKRIQVVIFHLKNIRTFELLLEKQN